MPDSGVVKLTEDTEMLEILVKSSDNLSSSYKDEEKFVYLKLMLHFPAY